MKLIYCLLFGVALLPNLIDAHGRLREPPSRSSMWRDGFINPPNYNDNELNCGGAGVNSFIHLSTFSYKI